MKLNLGCGRRILTGYTNVDLWHRDGSDPPDINADIRHVPLPDGCAEEVMAIHVVEHFYEWELREEVLPEFHRLLASGGLLVLELPDIVKACKNVLACAKAGVDLESTMKREAFTRKGHALSQGLFAIFGDPGERNPLNGHRYGYTFPMLARRLSSAGFKHIEEREPRFHPIGREMRDMRIEARKA